MVSTNMPGPSVPAVDGGGRITNDWYPILQRLVSQANNTTGSFDASMDAVLNGDDGRIPFVADGVLSTSARLFWDATNNRLGIGTAAPEQDVHIKSTSFCLVQIESALASVARFFDSGGPANSKYVDVLVDDGGLLIRALNDDASVKGNYLYVTASGNIGVGTTSPLNKLDISGGSFGRGAPVTKTGDFTLSATENWVICNKGSTLTVTFPAASSWTGREVMIKTIQAQTVVSASSNVAPLTSATPGTAILAATAGKWATLVSDGSNWIIMKGN